MALDPSYFFYSDGTISLTNGSDIATGDLVAWDPALLPFDFVFPNDGTAGATVIKEVLAVDQIRLAKPWTGPTLADVPYFALRFANHIDPRFYAVRVSEYLARLKAIPANFEEVGQQVAADRAAVDAVLTTITQAAADVETDRQAVDLAAAGIGDAQETVLTARDEAVSARDVAVSAAGSTAALWDSRAAAQAANIPAPVQYLRTAGHATAGDGGGSLYKRLGSAPSPAKAWHFQSADGAWWGLAESPVDICMLGAKGDGVTDDAAAILDACAYLGAAGGTVYIPNWARCLVDQNLTIPANVTLKGPHTMVGTPGDNSSSPYNDMGGALIINAASTITIKSNAGLSGLLIYRKGMNFPVGDGSVSFAGTAITFNGDDSFVERCLIMGFDKAIYAPSSQRPRMEWVNMDCNTGIEITDCWDTAYIAHCHAWPFAVIAYQGTLPIEFEEGEALEREGYAFHLHDGADWAKVTDCFSYGYAAGFVINSANSVTITGCGADNTFNAGGLNQGANGMTIAGASHDVRVSDFQASAHANAGVYVALNDGFSLTIEGANIWHTGVHAIAVVSGDVILSGNQIRNTPNGITIASATSRVLDGGGNRFEAVPTPWNLSAVTDKVTISPDNLYVGRANGTPAAGGNLRVPTIVSTDALQIPAQGEIFTVTGAQSFGGIAGGYAGRQIILIFDGSLTIYSTLGGTNAVLLKAGHLTTAAGTTLRLIHNGTQWFEA